MLDAARALVRDRCGLDFPSRRDADLARALRAASQEPAGPTPDALYHRATRLQTHFPHPRGLGAGLWRCRGPALIPLAPSFAGARGNPLPGPPPKRGREPEGSGSDEVREPSFSPSPLRGGGRGRGCAAAPPAPARAIFLSRPAGAGHISG